MRLLVAEADVERPRHAQEHVEVDERPGDREEDLLHEIRGDRPRQRAARDDGDEHQQGDERADVRRQEAVHCHADGIRRDDRPELDLVAIGRLEDAVVGEPGEERLPELEDEREDDVAGVVLPDRFDLVPEVAEPAPDVDSEQLENDPEERNGEEPQPDLDEPASPGGRQPERRLCRDLGHVRRVSLTRDRSATPAWDEAAFTTSQRELHGVATHAGVRPA